MNRKSVYLVRASYQALSPPAPNGWVLYQAGLCQGEVKLSGAPGHINLLDPQISFQLGRLFSGWWQVGISPYSFEFLREE